MRKFVLVQSTKFCLLGRGFHLSYAGPGGTLLLVDESSWRDINGIMFATRRRYVWVFFRRGPDL